MGFPSQIQNAQDNAKSSKKRIWKDYVPEAAVEEVEEQQKKEMDSERKVGYFLDLRFHPLFLESCNSI